MNLILFDTMQYQQLLPFTHTRPIADILCGGMTMRERWEKYLNVTSSSTLTRATLAPAFPVQYNDSGNLYVNAQIFVTEALGLHVFGLEEGQALVSGDQLIAIKTSQALSFDTIATDSLKTFNLEFYEGDALKSIQHPWDIFSLNDYAIRHDFRVLTFGKTAQPIPDYVTIIGDTNDIFIEEGATVLPSILNAKTGPIYIAKDAEVMEGSIIRGPFVLQEHAVIKMGAKIYGPTTIGAGSKVGGEVNNAVFFSHSNKGHDGFVGNCVIGSWCNLGADTNCSNLKNNYDEVSVYDEASDSMVKTGLQFCGLLMGDHSKCGINTMFNTGTVVGVSCNIYGGDFPDKFVPSFSWGGKNDMTIYRFDKAIETANRMMERRHLSLTEAETQILKDIYDQRVK